jgi:hypothetical protein
MTRGFFILASSVTFHASVALPSSGGVPAMHVTGVLFVAGLSTAEQHRQSLCSNDVVRSTVNSGTIKNTVCRLMTYNNNNTVHSWTQRRSKLWGPTVSVVLN